MPKPMKGVYAKNGVYWYTRINGKEQYHGKGKEGRELAVLAKKKHDVEKAENREVTAGIQVKRVELKTVSDLIDWYLSKPAVKKLASFNRKKQSCNHLKKFFGRYAVVSIEGGLQEEYRDERIEQGAAHQTVNLEIQTLSAAYHLAVKRRKIPVSAKPNEFIQEKERIRRRLITDKEYEKILEAAEPDFRDFLIIGYETGMRSSEIAKLKRKKFRLDESYMHDGQMVKIDYIALGTDTKNRTERFVPITAGVKAILKRRVKGLKPDDLIFTNGNGSRLPADAISLRMKYTCKRARVEYGDKTINVDNERTGIVFHCLRHTRITKWILAGYSDEVIRTWSGHKNLESFRTYVHLGKAVVVMFQNQFATKLLQNRSKAA
jgi:integrase